MTAESDFTFARWACTPFFHFVTEKQSNILIKCVPFHVWPKGTDTLSAFVIPRAHTAAITFSC